MNSIYHPAFILIIGAFIVPLIRGRGRSLFLTALPLLAFAGILSLPPGNFHAIDIAGHRYFYMHVDKLSLLFGYAFSIALFIGMLFAFKVEDTLQHVSALIYAGGAFGVIFSGGYFGLYIFWELMAVSSTFLILARRTQRAYGAAFRYILVHIFGGLCLLAGILIQFNNTGLMIVGFLELNSLAPVLIFIGIAVNAAIYPLHAWLKDAYPEATITGTVFLSAFTTKTAIYLMARVFPGADILIWLGAMMAVVPVIYALLEDDVRRIIAYSLINQGGFMICGIGIGTPLALNGAVSHAFCCIIYTALLFMAIGVVIEKTGKTKCSELGGLFRKMPLTGIFCIIGAMSISALPLFSGFVSKSMVISASSHGHLTIIRLLLQAASACACFHAGMKVPYYTFFNKDSGLDAGEPSFNMQLAMGIAAVLSVFIGIFPNTLYQLLPFQPAEYIPYTAAHIVGQLQVVLYGAAVFILLIAYNKYPVSAGKIYLDTDWFYIKGGRLFYLIMDKTLNSINRWCDKLLACGLSEMAGRVARNAPTRLSLYIMIPLKSVSGAKRFSVAKLDRNIRTAFETGSVPVGVSAAAAVCFITLFFLLS